MSQSRSVRSLHGINHDSQHSDYSATPSHDANSRTELQRGIGWWERRQVFHSNSRKSDWKFAAAVYLLLIIFAMQFI